jgi:hypothetical protein
MKKSLPHSSKHGLFPIGSRVIVPDPSPADCWQFGNFSARVIAMRENGNLLVEDQDADVWEVEPSRLALEQEDSLGCS